MNNTGSKYNNDAAYLIASYHVFLSIVIIISIMAMQYVGISVMLHLPLHFNMPNYSATFDIIMNTAERKSIYDAELPIQPLSAHTFNTTMAWSYYYEHHRK